MSKRKILTLALTIAMAAILAIGGTLAYFTDFDQVENVFTIGDLDIDVCETVGIKDKDGIPVTSFIDVPDGDEEGHTFENLMPTYTAVKDVDVKNVSETNDAYVRVFITMNNFKAINKAIDEVYEEKDKTAEEIQAMYDEVFDGFGIHYSKEPIRGWMTKKSTADVEVLAVDYVRAPAQTYQFSNKNVFLSEAEKAGPTFSICQLGGNGGYYYDALKPDENRTYIIYLKMKPAAKYDLFNGLNVPAEFDAEQMKMFDDLKINVYADAIQTVGFDSWQDAFNALEAEHHMGWWNS